MTQSSMFAVAGEGWPEPTLLLDTCVPMWLDGLNKEGDEQPRYTPEEQNLIWLGLQGMAAAGKIRLIPEAREELHNRHPAALARLAEFSRARPPAKTRDVMLAYQKVAWKMGVRHRSMKNPADPWLVAYAEVYGFTVLSDELEKHLHKHPENRLYVPDACKERLVPCYTLTKYAQTAGWIPPRAESGAANHRH